MQQPTTITPIDVISLNECPHCGTETEFINDSDAHVLDVWLKDNYGEKLEDVATDYTETRTGFTWGHGGNYGIIDSDLLGGNGDETRAYKASTVFQFLYDDSADKTEESCGYCARFA